MKATVLIFLLLQISYHSFQLKKTIDFKTTSTKKEKSFCLIPSMQAYFFYWVNLVLHTSDTEFRIRRVFHVVKSKIVCFLELFCSTNLRYCLTALTGTFLNSSINIYISIICSHFSDLINYCVLNVN